MKTIEESEMSFGPFPSENVFHFEKCPAFLALPRQPKVVEFLLYKKCPNNRSTILFVEAKRSAPKDNITFLFEMQEKLVNSLLFFHSLRLNRRDGCSRYLSQKFINASLKQTEYIFVLVMKEFEDAWLDELKQKLHRHIQHLHSSFRLSSLFVSVLNEKKAARLRLVTPTD